MPVGERAEGRVVRINYGGKGLPPEVAKSIDEAIGLGASVDYNGPSSRLEIGEAPPGRPSPQSRIPSTLAHALDLEAMQSESRAVRPGAPIAKPAPLAPLEKPPSDFDRFLELIKENWNEVFKHGNPDCQIDERAA